MVTHGSSYLIEQLLNNKLSRAELDHFLASLHDEQAVQAYSPLLEAYFDELLKKNDSHPAGDASAD